MNNPEFPDTSSNIYVICRDDRDYSNLQSSIGLDLRVIALKTAIVNSNSIMEAALLSHAILRNYNLNKDEKKRTFGNIIDAWKKDQQGKQELRHYLRLLKWFNFARNHIHLSKITKNESYFEDMCKKELK